MKAFFIRIFLILSILFFHGDAFAAITWEVPEKVSQGRGFVVTFESENPFKGKVVWRKKNVPIYSQLTPQKKTRGVEAKKLYTAKVLLGMPVGAKNVHSLSMVMKEDINGQKKLIKKRTSVKPLAVKWVSHSLKVAPKYVNPPKKLLNKIKAEREQRAPVMAKISPNPTWELPFLRPVKGTISGSFAARRVFNGTPRSPHMGTDMRGAIGTPIYSMANGTVVLVEHHYYSGNVVFVDHGQGVISMYAHMSAFSVKKGDVVEKGQEIGKVGATGRVTGPHLHLSLYIQGVGVDAIPFTMEDFQVRGGPTPEQARPPVTKKKSDITNVY